MVTDEARTEREVALANALRAAPGGLDALLALAAVRLESGDAQTAIACARVAHHLAPQSAPAGWMLGRALTEAGEWASAIEVLRRALEIPRNEADTSGEAAARIALGRALFARSNVADAIVEFKRASDLVPQSGLALARLGEALAHAKRYPEAFAVLNRAIVVDPACGRAYTELAEALIDVGRPAAALVPLEKALALDTGRGAPAVAFAQALARQGKLADALPWFNRALEIEPTCAEAFRHMGRTLAALRFDKEALDCIRAARQLRGGDWPETWMDEAGLLLRRGDFRAGWRAYENREIAMRLLTITPPVWNGDDDLAGESILLIAEQGLGDTLQFFRFARRVAMLGAHVTVEVQPPLRDLLARSVQHVAQSGGIGLDAGPGPGADSDTDTGTGSIWSEARQHRREKTPSLCVIGRGDPQPAFTRQNSLVSMPYALRADGESYGADVPYLFASAERIPVWRDKLDVHAQAQAHAADPGAARAPLRVGLVTSGNPLFIHDADRSMPLAEASSLFMRPDTQWVIVQPELRARDRATLDAHPSVWLCGHELRDFDDTAALLASLDLVISVDTGVAHLAGAMGRPVWLLLPFFGDWRWGHDRSDSPWYPTATLFRQAAPQDWSSVMTAVSDALDAWPRG